jgi:hypothetical protein
MLDIARLLCRHARSQAGGRQRRRPSARRRGSSSTVACTAIRRPTPTGWTARTSARRAGSAS